MATNGSRIVIGRLLLGHCLLAHADRLLRTLARPRVRLGPLAAHGQATPVAEAAIRADVGQSLDVARNLSPQVALDLDPAVDRVAQGLLIGLGEVLDPNVRIAPRLLQYLLGRRQTDAIDVRQRDLDALLARQIDPGDTCHYPCTCLCLGLVVQITRTLPSRRMMMHFSQTRLTDGRTFMMLLVLLLVAVRDAPAAPIVGC